MPPIRNLAIALSAFLVTLIAFQVYAASSPSVSFVSPKDGDTVTSPVKVVMGAENVKVVPAGEIKEGQGHHHLLIDSGSVKKGEVIPADATHLHFGKAQTETEVQLAPGRHTLTLQFADGAHRSYGSELSSTIDVTVK